MLSSKAHSGPGIKRVLGAGAIALGVLTGGLLNMALASPAGAASGYGPYHVIGTGSNGLNERVAPSASAAKTGNLSNGTTVYLACQAAGITYSTGGSPASDDIWDELTNGSFVADYWVSTPEAGKFSSGIPRCGISQVSVWNENVAAQYVTVCGTNQHNQANVCTPWYRDLPGSNNYYPDYWFKGEFTVWTYNDTNGAEYAFTRCDVPAGYSSSVLTCEI
jgi:hypothetical protein